MAGVVQVADQLVSIEVLVRIEDMTHEHPPRLGELFAPDLEELAEFLDRRLGNHHGCQLIALHFRPDSDSHAGAGSRRPGSTRRAVESIMILHSSVGRTGLPVGESQTIADVVPKRQWDGSTGVSGITASASGFAAGVSGLAARDAA